MQNVSMDLDRDYASTEGLEDLAYEITKDAETDVEKAVACYEWIHDNITFGYSQIIIKNREYALRTPQEVLEDEEGVCYEQSYLFKSLLDAAGVEDTHCYVSADYFGYGHMVAGIQVDKEEYHVFDLTKNEHHQFSYINDSITDLTTKEEQNTFFAQFENPFKDIGLLLYVHVLPSRITKKSQGDNIYTEFHNIHKSTWSERLKLLGQTNGQPIAPFKINISEKEYVKTKWYEKLFFGKHKKTADHSLDIFFNKETNQPCAIQYYDGKNTKTTAIDPKSFKDILDEFADENSENHIPFTENETFAIASYIREYSSAGDYITSITEHYDNLDVKNKIAVNTSLAMIRFSQWLRSII